MAEYFIVSSEGQKYVNVMEDMDSSQRISALDGRPWTFINLLPIPLTLYITYTNKVELVGQVSAKSKMVATHTQQKILIQGGQEIHATYKRGDAVYEILRPITLLYDDRIIKLGDVVSDTKDTTMTIRSHADISGLRIHNRIAIPLNITFQGNIVGSVDKDDGTNYQSGSTNSVFLNNNGRGFKMGDILSFSFRDGTKYCEVALNDNYMTDVYVGVINQKFVPIMDDYYSYRLTSDINGLGYFENEKTAYYGY